MSRHSRYVTSCHVSSRHITSYCYERGLPRLAEGLWVRPCDHCFGRMDLIEQDTNTPVDKASNWYVLFRTKRGKLLPFSIMFYKLQLLIGSSKVSSLCTQCSDRKYSFSSSAICYFLVSNSKLPTFQSNR